MMGLSVFLSAVLLVVATESEYRAKLQELEAKLKATRQKLQQLETQEKDLERQLRLLDEERKTLQQMIRTTRQEERRVRRRLDLLNRRIQEGHHRLGIWLEALKVSAQDAAIEHVWPEDDPVLSLVATQMTHIAKSNLERYRSEVQQLRVWKKDREKAWQAIRSLRKRLEKDEQTLAAVERKRRALLKKVQQQKKQTKTREQEILEDKRKLEALLRELAQKSKAKREAQGVPTRPLKRGLLSWPVHGQVIAEFGMMKDPKYGTKVKNNGIDILSAPGSEIRAAADGEVVFAGPFLSYRNMVILDHHGFLTVYAYLDVLYVQVGDQVDRGTPIGRLGDQQPILHFEVRREGKAVNPLRYLGSS